MLTSFNYFILFSENTLLPIFDFSHASITMCMISIMSYGIYYSYTLLIDDGFCYYLSLAYNFLFLN